MTRDKSLLWEVFNTEQWLKAKTVIFFAFASMRELNRVHKGYLETLSKTFRMKLQASMLIQPVCSGRIRKSEKEDSDTAETLRANTRYGYLMVYENEILKKSHRPKQEAVPFGNWMAIIHDDNQAGQIVREIFIFWISG